MRKFLTRYYENKIKKEFSKQENLFDEISKILLAINFVKENCSECIDNDTVCKNFNKCIINDTTITQLLLKEEKLKLKLQKSSYKIAIYNLKQSSL